VALVARRDDLRGALKNPFLGAATKIAIAREILERAGADAKTVRFILLLIEHGRLEILQEVAAAVPEAWNERLGSPPSRSLRSSP